MNVLEEIEQKRIEFEEYIRQFLGVPDVCVDVDVFIYGNFIVDTQTVNKLGEDATNLNWTQSERGTFRSTDDSSKTFIITKSYYED